MFMEYLHTVTGYLCRSGINCFSAWIRKKCKVFQNYKYTQIVADPSANPSSRYDCACKKLVLNSIAKVVFIEMIMAQYGERFSYRVYLYCFVMPAYNLLLIC